MSDFSITKAPNNNNAVVFVPHWFTNIIDRGAISIEDLFDLDKLYQHCSIEDLTGLFWINSKAYEYFDIQSSTELIYPSAINPVMKDTAKVFENHINPQVVFFEKQNEERLFLSQQSKTPEVAFKTATLQQNQNRPFVVIVFVYPQHKEPKLKERLLFELCRSIISEQFEHNKTIHFSKALTKYLEML